MNPHEAGIATISLSGAWQIAAITVLVAGAFALFMRRLHLATWRVRAEMMATVRDVLEPDGIAECSRERQGGLVSKTDLTKALDAIKANQDTLRKAQAAQVDFAKRAQASSKLADEAFEGLRKAGVLKPSKTYLPRSSTGKLSGRVPVKPSSRQPYSLKQKPGRIK